MVVPRDGLPRASTFNSLASDATDVHRTTLQGFAAEGFSARLIEASGKQRNRGSGRLGRMLQYV